MLANMYGYIKFVGKTRLLIDVNHLSYWINIHENTKFVVNDKKAQRVNCLQIQQLTKNNIINNEIYGFETIEELNFFRDLLSCQGIGPKTGMAILQNDLMLVQSLIKNNDVQGLNELPGINSKVANALVSHNWKPWMLTSAFRRHANEENDHNDFSGKKTESDDDNNFDETDEELFGTTKDYDSPMFNQTYNEISDTLKSLGYSDDLIHDTLIGMDINENDDVSCCVSEAIKLIAMKQENEHHTA
ncbi:Holliday junction branch migration protein RuvA [[Mycoplasma] testudinis]|uniref:Holliday junction branch migration protein RuvA n=1 Tax=[Mycoplasma] testudinis TaxID=33924 RepID=UPI000483F0AC|nr:Holliday junction branch migration protein RuvA [[Mycoplasma] testudinis]